MPVADTARRFYALLAALSTQAGDGARQVWRELDKAAVAASWSDVQAQDRLLVAVSSLQQAAAEQAVGYVAQALLDQGVVPEAEALVLPTRLAGIASDGRNLDDLLAQPLITTLTALRGGATTAAALDLGENALATIAATQVSDAGRSAVSVAMTTQPTATGWVRMLVPPSCGRCAVLAGRVYRWSSGFDRHPNDDCVHIPAAEGGRIDDLRTDPRAYFDSLSAADQDRYFGAAATEAIRDGADIGQVVNARRGAAGLSRPGRLTADEQRMLRGGKDRGRLGRVDVFGRPVFVTTEGTTRRGVAGKRLIAAGGETGTRSRDERRADRAAGRTDRRYSRAKTPRLMPESIAEIAGDDRELRLKLLRRFGYIL